MRHQALLLPRAAPADRLRVWLGVNGYTAPPRVAWRLNGEPATPTTLRPLESARARNVSPQGPPRAFTAVYEFTQGVRPATWYRVEADVAGGAEAAGAGLAVRTLPSEVPGGSAWFNVLLVSCYYRHRDRNHRVGTVLPRLRADDQPHLSLFMGDQVYLDMPALSTSGRDSERLEQKFEEDYVRNWFAARGFGGLLAAAPAVCLPDDHEYWNNYPESALWIPRVGSQWGRDDWDASARRLLQAFQVPVPETTQDAVVIDVPPVSFFCMDNRSHRQGFGGSAAHPQAVAKFHTWARRVAGEGHHGVLVTGQPITEAPAARGAFDYALSNFSDFRDLAQGVAEIREGGGSVLLVTGDKHWGRLLLAPGTGRAGGLGEVVVSPASLVTTPGKDLAREVGNFLGGLFGGRDPWPRHSVPDEHPDCFPAHAAPDGTPASGLACGPKLRCQHVQKGDQVGVLSFRRRGGRSVDVRMTWYPVVDTNARGPHARPVMRKFEFK